MYERIESDNKTDLWNEIRQVLATAVRFAYPPVTVDVTRVEESLAACERTSLLETERQWEEDPKTVTDVQFALHCEVSHHYYDELDRGEDVLVTLATFRLPRDEKLEKLIRIAVAGNQTILWTEHHDPDVGSEYLHGIPMIPFVAE